MTPSPNPGVNVWAPTSSPASPSSSPQRAVFGADLVPSLKYELTGDATDRCVIEPPRLVVHDGLPKQHDLESTDSLWHEKREVSELEHHRPLPILNHVRGHLI